MRQVSEFTMHAHSKRRGFTTVEAHQFLRQEFPHIDTWTCWVTDGGGGFDSLTETADGAERGQIGNWAWRREESTYPAVSYCRHLGVRP